MAKEIEDKEFEELLQEKRHKEVTAALKGVATAISNNKDAEILKALEGQPGKLEAGIVKSFETAISKLPKPEKSEVNVEINSNELVSLFRQALREEMKGFTGAINDLKDAILNRPQPEGFKIKRDGWYNMTDIEIKFNK
jgi:hypothetical protein